MLNRKKAPDFKLDYKFNYAKSKSIKLKNKQNFHFVPSLNQKMIKLEMVFDAGYVYHENSIIPTTVAQLLFEGTKNKTANEIAELIEGEGAFYDANCGAESFSITIYVLQKNVEKVVNVLIDVVQNAVFPQDEIDKYLQIQKQKFKVNKEKVSFLVRNKFSELLYPKGSRYYSALNEHNFDLINQNELIEFYNNFIKNKQFRVYAAGFVNEGVIKLIDDNLGEIEVNRTDADNFIEIPSIKDYSIQLIEKEDALQSGIRIGQLAIPKNHEDYPKLFLLNTVLGGYFGSRLMNNIREDKGYTYGIGSGIVSNKSSSKFFISTEVGFQYTKATINEIEKEIKILQENKIPESELELVKNYLFGSFMRNFDGAFEAIDRFKAINELGLDYAYYENFFLEIKNANSGSLKTIAEKYFNFDRMIKVVAGKLI